MKRDNKYLFCGCENEETEHQYVYNQEVEHYGEVEVYACMDCGTKRIETSDLEEQVKSFEKKGIFI